MLSSYDIEQRALEKLGAFRQEAERLRTLRVGVNVMRLYEPLRKRKPATSMTTPECVAATIFNAK